MQPRVNEKRRERRCRFQISDLRSQTAHTAENSARKQISDFRSQIPDPRRPGNRTRAGRFQISDSRFQVASSQKYRRKTSGKQISKRAEHIPTQHIRFLQGSDFRFQISECGSCPGDFWYRFQISENRKQRARVRFQRGEDFRFQISQRSGPVWHVQCRFQISELSAPRSAGVSGFSVSHFRKHKPGPIRQEISVVCLGRKPEKTRSDPKR